MGLALPLACQTGATDQGIDVGDIDRVEAAPVGGTGCAYARLQDRAAIRMDGPCETG